VEIASAKTASQRHVMDLSIYFEKAIVSQKLSRQRQSQQGADQTNQSKQSRQNEQQ
jgi:hypothetical protein